MSDQTTTNEQDKTIDFEKAMKSIEDRVTEKLSEGIKDITSKLAPKEEVKDDDIWGTDDEFVSKKDLPTLVEKVTEKVKAETTKAIATQTMKSSRDAEAVRDFPELDDKSPQYSKQFHSEVANEIKARVAKGRSPDDLDLIYDAAASVAAKGARQGWYIPKPIAEAKAKAMGARDDSFDVRGSRESGEPTEGQLKFAASLGMNKEKLTQLLKKTSKI